MSMLENSCRDLVLYRPGPSIDDAPPEPPRMPRRKNQAYIIDEDGKHRPGSSTTSRTDRDDYESDTQSSTGPVPKPRDAQRSSSKQRRQPNPPPTKGKGPANYRRPQNSAKFRNDSKRDESPGVGPSRGPRLVHRASNSKENGNFNSFNGYSSYYARPSQGRFSMPTQVTPYGYHPFQPFNQFPPMSAPLGASYFQEPSPAYSQFPYQQPPAPPANEATASAKAPAPAPAPSQEVKKEEKNEEKEAIEKLKQELDSLKEQHRAKELQEEQQRELEKKIRQQMEQEMMEKAMAEEQKRLDIARVREEAAREAREAAEVEKRAREESRRLEEEAIERIKKEARERLEREHEAELERKKREAEESQRLMREAEARLVQQLEEHRKRREKEEENQRLLREKEAKLAQELEEHRKRREQEEEEKKQMFQKLKDEIRAEIMEEESRYLSSSGSGSGSMRSYRTTATSQSSVIDPFEFLEGQSTPTFDQPRKSSRRQEPYWTWNQWSQPPANWPYQVYVANTMDQNFGHVHPGMPSTYERQRWHLGPEYSQGGSSRGSRAGPDPRHSHYQSPSAQARFPKVSADDDDDSDNGTVIPPASHRTQSQPNGGNAAQASGPSARGGLSPLRAPPDGQSLVVGVAALDITNGNPASPSRTHQSSQGAGDRLTETKTQEDTSWTTAPLGDETMGGKGKETANDYNNGKSRETIPDTDGGANLAGHLTHQPSTSKPWLEQPGDDGSRDGSRDGSGGAQQHQPGRPSPVHGQATRDSPLLPLLAKHVSEFERHTSQPKRPSNLRRETLSSANTDTEDSYQHPYPPDAAAWPSWPDNDVPEVLFPYYRGRQENWSTYGPRSRRMDSKSGTSDCTYEPEAPMALVPCFMLPMQMVQSPMQVPMFYPGMMQPRRSRRRQPSNSQPEYEYSS